MRLRGPKSSARSRIFFADGDPGASDVLTHDGTDRPNSYAFLATHPAATSSAGSDVFVQLVIAAIVMAPSGRSPYALSDSGR